MGNILEKTRRALTICRNLLQKPGALTLSFDNFRFLSDRETLHYLKKKGVGIIRFGDGDLRVLAGGSTGYQKYNPELQKKLAEVLLEYEGNSPFLIAIPLDLFFEGQQAYNRRGASPSRWRGVKHTALPFLKRNHVYGSPFCFKNINMTDAEKREHVAMMKSLVENKDVIYIGIEKHAESIRNIVIPKEFIPIPPTNSFDSYEAIKQRAIQAAKKFSNPIVFITASVTANVLSEELNKRGILTYDIGVPFPRK